MYKSNFANYFSTDLLNLKWLLIIIQFTIAANIFCQVKESSPNKVLSKTDKIKNITATNNVKLEVPKTYPTIQSAINAAENGDTVLVSEGTYVENINFNGKNIIVASNYIISNNLESIKSTIIDGSNPTNPDSASVVSLVNGEDSTAVLEGFTITGGNGTLYDWPNGNSGLEGGGIILSHSNAIVRNNIIINNSCKTSSGKITGGGGGIATMYGNPTIYNNIIAFNTSGYSAGFVFNWSGGTLKNNIIYNNYGGSTFGTGGIMIWESPTNSVKVENNIIIGNVSYKDAGAIRIRKSSSSDSYSIRNNIIWYNKQQEGNQINGDESLLSYNSIEDFSGGTNITVKPEFGNDSFVLSDISTLIDAGDPDQMYNDLIDSTSGLAQFPSKGGLRNDIGVFGGSLTNLLPSFDCETIVFSNSSIKVNVFNSSPVIEKIHITKLGFKDLQIDSVINIDTSTVKLTNNLIGVNIAAWNTHTISLSINPINNGTYLDTIYVYHNLQSDQNPKKIALEVKKVTFTDVEESNTPTEFKLEQNYPNPFNPVTIINYSIPVNNSLLSQTILKVYDILGREVTTLVNDRKAPGSYSVKFDASNLNSGVYFYQLKFGDYVATKKLMLLK